MGRHDNPLERAPDGQLYLGSAIRQHRYDAGYTVDELAEKLGIHPASLSKVENNKAKPSDALLGRAAEALGIAVDGLQRAPLHPAISSPTMTHGLRFHAGFAARTTKPADADGLGTNARQRRTTLQEILEQLYDLQARVEELLAAEDVCEPEGSAST